jgi:hypothetical protein
MEKAPDLQKDLINFNEVFRPKNFLFFRIADWHLQRIVIQNLPNISF